MGMGWFPDHVGGLNRYLRDLHLAQAVAGQEPVSVVLGPLRQPVAGVLPVSAASDHLFRRLLAVARAVRRHQQAVDVVDVHFALYGLLPALLRRDLPLVVHFQGPWALESEAVGRARWSLAARGAVERAVYRRATRLIVLSQPFADLLVARYGVPQARIRVIPPGVDLARFTPAAAAGDGGPSIVAARRLVPRMGLDVLLRALPLLETSDVRLTVVGAGPELPALQALAVALGVDDRTDFAGEVDDDELVRRYREADVVAVPSLALEGFGLVVLEALACGTPAVVTRVGGLPEAVAGLDPGLVVPPEDPAALARALDRVLTGHGPSPAACRKHAEGFGWARAVQSVDEVYQQARDRPLRVVYLDHCGKRSGAELALLRLLPALEGIEAHVIFGEDGPVLADFASAGLSHEVLALQGRTNELGRDSVRAGRLPVAAVWDTTRHVVRLAHRLRQLRPDLVHGNSLKACLYGSVAARLAGVPFVWHARDHVDVSYLPGQAVFLVRAAARHLPAVVIANSRSTLETLRLADRTGTAVVQSVVHDLVPPHNLVAVGVAEANRPVMLAVIGRLSPWKGQHVFLRAFASAFSGTPVRARLVGTALFGEYAYEAELQALVVELGIAHQVEFRGHRQDVAAELSEVDVLVHCSTSPEPFGQVVLEGMAAGVPVLAADAGGPAEVIRHAVDGWLVTPDDVDALARAMRHLVDDPVLRAQLASAGLSSVKSFAPDRIGRQVVNVYLRALGRNDRALHPGCAS